MKKLHILCFFAFLVGVLSSCEEEGKRISENRMEAPGVVTNVSIENLPGAAKISFTAPKDPDLLYIKAEYTLASGRKMQVKSSYYNNSLMVEGFGEQVPHTVLLYAVNRSEVQSEPLEVVVNPLENPIWDTFRSLEAIAAFGGIRITASNEVQKNVTIEIMKDSLGEWVPSVDNIYSEAKNITRTIRGLDTIPQTFAITVRDKYLNYTDTLVTELTPLYESALPKSRYAPVVLPTDAAMAYQSTVLRNLWDGETFHWPNVVVTVANGGLPQWITFDVGQLAKMSRIVIWNYSEYTNSGRMYYYGGNLKDFEIWGSTNPAPDGSWDSWTLLGKYDDTKPSGLPYGQQSPEDYELAYNGISYDFDVAASKMRFIRIKSNKNWVGSSFMALAEVQVYGDAR